MASNIKKTKHNRFMVVLLDTNEIRSGPVTTNAFHRKMNKKSTRARVQEQPVGLANRQQLTANR
jgi:hypothetical protein